MVCMTRWAGLAVAAFALAATLVMAPTASADLPQLLETCVQRDAEDGETAADITLPYYFCDDGVPTQGGRTPNETGARAIEVPAAYDGATGLPDKAAEAASVAGADTDGNIALDVDLSLPDPAEFPAPAGGYPLVVMMHGCCSGNKTSWEGDTIDPGGKENWHYNNAWFASRGYVVITYTSRGFVGPGAPDGPGSTGETQLDSDLYEINDYQHLAGQLADHGDLLLDDPGTVEIDPSRVVPTGGSYGGGFSWMALTDPTWESPSATDPKVMRVAAVGTKYGWTNLVEALVPNGADRRDDLPTSDPDMAAEPLGYPKQTINAGLYASGELVTSNHTTFPKAIDDAQACLTSSDPFETNPLCNGTAEPLVTDTIGETLPRFINERSAYYQSEFFQGLASGSVEAVPVFSAGAFTDQLFTAHEHRRMVERLKASLPAGSDPYPVQEYYGDYNHFVQNKRKEWADICGADRHVCTYDDYPPDGSGGRDLNADPPTLVNTPTPQAGRGVTTRLNRFIDHYARPPANSEEPAPSLDVSGSLQVCPENAGDLGSQPDEAGPRFTAANFAELAPFRFTFAGAGAQPTTSVATPNEHAKNADPVANSADNGGACPVEDSPGGAPSAELGVATYDSPELPSAQTMMGMTRLTIPHTGTSTTTSLQLNARMYDLYPDGTQVLVDRGTQRLTNPIGTTVMDLHGNGWRFEQGHKMRIEIAQDDAPYVKSSVPASSLSIAGVQVSVPVREPNPSSGGGGETGGGGIGAGSGGGSGASASGSGSPQPGAPPRVDVRSPRLASDTGRTGRFRISIRNRGTATSSSASGYELQIRQPGAGASRTRRARLSADALSFVFRGKPGRTYVIRARAVNSQGRKGRYDTSRTVVPVDDGRFTRRTLRYAGRWREPRNGKAYGGRLSWSNRRGARISYRFRGDRLYLVGRRSRRGGKALAVLNGRRRVVSFYGRRTANRKVIATLRGKSRGVNKFRVVNLGRKGARNGRGTRVELDALGARRLR
jgi:hypothetical protein